MTILEETFPRAKNRFFQGYDVISSAGPFYFFIAPMITFVVLLTELATEKEKRLRHGLQVVGVTAAAYWTSWFIVSAFFSMVIGLVLLIAGLCFQFTSFLNTPALLLILLFFLFGMSMQFLMYFTYTCVPSIKVAYTSGYALLLLGLVIEIILDNLGYIRENYSIDISPLQFLKDYG
jgi:uncharacterized membrane protein